MLQPLRSYTQDSTQPLFANRISELVQLMKSKSVEDIAILMDLSPELARLNFKRYQNFLPQENCPISQSYPALFLFQGDVYQSLKAISWDHVSVDYSQSHLRILSGLYGLLRPLDAIQPYRLEMGVRLRNSYGKNLYDFWKNCITNTINQQLDLQVNPILINLASIEYFKAIDVGNMAHPIVTINFYENKNNELKMIGIHAKKARGTMVKYIMENQIDTLEELVLFTDLGYRFNPDSSSDTHLDFIRVY